MCKGKIISINISPASGKPMQSVNEVRAVPGKGLEGDRYFNQKGTFSDKPGEGRQVTLIEIEVVEALERDQGIILAPADVRRNLITRDVSLNHLVGKRFRVGEVIMTGIRLCEPCEHLAMLTKPEVLPALIHRGGLRADILLEGYIRVGDVVQDD